MLHQHGYNIFCLNKSGIEKRKAGKGHEKDKSGCGQDSGSIVRINRVTCQRGRGKEQNRQGKAQPSCEAGNQL